MGHEAKNFDHLLGKLQGISDNQLKQHFTLYQGYVKKINEIEEKLAKQDSCGLKRSALCRQLSREGRERRAVKPIYQHGGASA